MHLISNPYKQIMIIPTMTNPNPIIIYPITSKFVDYNEIAF
jgi:hypothetical protein